MHPLHRLRPTPDSNANSNFGGFTFQPNTNNNANVNSDPFATFREEHKVDMGVPPNTETKEAVTSRTEQAQSRYSRPWRW